MIKKVAAAVIIMLLCGVATAETTSLKDVENVLKPVPVAEITAVKTPEVLTNGRGPQLSSTVMTISKEPKGSLVVVQ
jgi:branched-subunit amino acid transport protein